MRTPSILIVALCLTSGCSRTPKAHTSPEKVPPAAAKAATPTTEVKPTAVVQRSEFVATGKPTPPCRDCDHADGGAVPQHGEQPKLKLDEKTLNDAKATVTATCDLLEAGVQILEANVKAPDKAATALRSYQSKHQVEIKATLHRAEEVKGRLRAAGYDQDIPEELRPDFEKRMGQIQTRLEKMRTVYAKHPAVLEAFGAFFPRRK